MLNEKPKRRTIPNLPWITKDIEPEIRVICIRMFYILNFKLWRKLQTGRISSEDLSVGQFYVLDL